MDKDKKQRPKSFYIAIILAVISAALLTAFIIKAGAEAAAEKRAETVGIRLCGEIVELIKAYNGGEKQKFEEIRARLLALEMMEVSAAKKEALYAELYKCRAYFEKYPEAATSNLGLLYTAMNNVKENDSLSGLKSDLQSFNEAAGSYSADK